MTATKPQLAALAKAQEYLAATAHIQGSAGGCHHAPTNTHITQAQLRHLVALAEKSTTTEERR